MEQASSHTGFAEVNGASLYYEEAGDGHPLLLIHGGLGDCRMWDDQWKAFAQHFRTIRFDVRGFGRSALPPGEYSFANDVAGLLDVLGAKQAHVIGISMGGKIAIDFALVYPHRVSALIPVASALGGYRFSSATMALIDEADRYLDAGDIATGVELENRLWIDGPSRTPEMVDPLVRERVREMNSAHYRRPQVDAESSALTPPAAERLGEIGVPALIVTGDQDVPDILEIAETLSNGIPGARSVVVQNAAHHPQMERPAQFNELVLDFLTVLPVGIV